MGKNSSDPDARRRQRLKVMLMKEEGYTKIIPRMTDE
jgi:hypothetical protein